jgi:uncharacterized protein (TIGR00730 family)
VTEVCVFCGSSPGVQPSFTEAAALFGNSLAARDLGLVYGGASIGLMGVVADAVITAGGRVTGVITESLAEHEISHRRLSKLEVVTSMHERKARMAALSDAFVMLPGGFGTYEEFMESVTWAQLGIHDKPCAILNVNGFFDQLLAFLDHAVAMGFIKSERMHGIVVSENVTTLLDSLVAVPA